jgi:PTH1 family peptidyl-tRNA hydrolase
LRLRIGVGLSLPTEAIAAGGGRRPGRDYLLSPLRKADLSVLDEVLDRVATATRRVVSEGPGPAMNEFNRKEDRDQGSGIRDQK